MSGKRITVGLAFDDMTDHLTKLGERFGQAFDLPVKFIHVVNPISHAPYAGVMGEQSPLWDVTASLTKAQQNMAREKLAEVTEKLECETETDVYDGNFFEWINADALATNSLLVIAGHHRRRIFPEGFSKVQKMVKHAQVPILITNGQHEIPDNPRIMCADDLVEDSLQVANFGAELCRVLKAQDFYHVFVNGLSREGLRTGLDTAALAERAPSLLPDVFDEIVKDLENKLREKLVDRFVADNPDHAQKLYEYFPVVLSGGAEDKLIKFIKESKPDMLIFGKHRRVHTEPFHFGQLPLSVLLKTNIPIVIVPVG